MRLINNMRLIARCAKLITRVYGTVITPLAHAPRDTITNIVAEIGRDHLCIVIRPPLFTETCIRKIPGKFGTRACSWYQALVPSPHSTIDPGYNLRLGYSQDTKIGWGGGGGFNNILLYPT